jgi:hypothetical protein
MTTLAALIVLVILVLAAGWLARENTQLRRERTDARKRHIAQTVAALDTAREEVAALTSRLRVVAEAVDAVRAARDMQIGWFIRLEKAHINNLLCAFRDCASPWLGKEDDDMTEVINAWAAEIGSELDKCRRGQAVANQILDEFVAEFAADANADQETE